MNCHHFNDKTPAPIDCKKKIDELLVFIAETLETNNIPYWLDYGTILGATRYKDFIPWDIDVDLSLFDVDKEKVKEVFERAVANKSYIFRNAFEGSGFQVYYSKDVWHHTDLFFWYEDKDFLRRKHYVGMDHERGTDVRKGRDFPKAWVEELSQAKLGKRMYSVPKDPEHFCEFRYGKAWKVPMTIREWNRTDPKTNLTIRPE